MKHIFELNMDREMKTDGFLKQAEEQLEVRILWDWEAVGTGNE